MGHSNELVEKYIDPDRYDLLIYLTPDVRWVPDGQRLNGDEDRRTVLKTRWWWSAGTIHSGWRMPSGWWTSFWAARSHRVRRFWTNSLPHALDIAPGSHYNDSRAS